MGYRPDPGNPARRLSLRKTGQDIIKHLIAAFIPVQSSRASYYLQMFQGILEELTPAGYAVVLADVPPSPTETELPHIFASNELDGIIIANGFFHDPLLERIRRLNPHADWPVVAMIYPMDGSSVVMSDDRNGAYLQRVPPARAGTSASAAVCLPEVSGLPFAPAHRLEGVRQAMRERQLDPERHLHIFPLNPPWYSPDAFTRDEDNQRIPSVDASEVKDRFLKLYACPSRSDRHSGLE